MCAGCPRKVESVPVSLYTWRISMKAASDQLSMLSCMSTASRGVDSLLSKGAESQLPACILASWYIASSSIH